MIYSRPGQYKNYVYLLYLYLGYVFESSILDLILLSEKIMDLSEEIAGRILYMFSLVRCFQSIIIN